MTKQEIFDKVATHLLNQGEKSMNGLECAYRGGYGMSCAIGCLIPNEKYTAGMEKMGLRNPAIVNVLEDNGVDCEVTNYFLLVELMRIHDELNVSDWPTALANLAERFLLNLTVFMVNVKLPVPVPINDLTTI